MRCLALACRFGMLVQSDLRPWTWALDDYRKKQMLQELGQDALSISPLEEVLGGTSCSEDKAIS
jgi:hypothetical protein